MEEFRSALHGFNRNDVVQFIQQQTAQHEKEMRIAREEAARLTQELDNLRRENDNLSAECEGLAARVAQLTQEAAAQPTPAAQPKDLDAPLTPTATVVEAAPSSFNELELAAYRRAELTERMARERAATCAERLKAIFTQTDEKLSVTAQDVLTLMDAFQTSFDQLQQVLDTTKRIVAESSANMKVVADTCDEIKS